MGLQAQPTLLQRRQQRQQLLLQQQQQQQQQSQRPTQSGGSAGLEGGPERSSLGLRPTIRDDLPSPDALRGRDSPLSPPAADHDAASRREQDGGSRKDLDGGAQGRKGQPSPAAAASRLLLSPSFLRQSSMPARPALVRSPWSSGQVTGTGPGTGTPGAGQGQGASPQDSSQGASSTGGLNGALQATLSPRPFARASSLRTSSQHSRTPSAGVQGLASPGGAAGGGGAPPVPSTLSRLSQPLSIAKPPLRSAAQGLPGTGTGTGGAGPSPRLQPPASPLPRPPCSPPISPSTPARDWASPRPGQVPQGSTGMGASTGVKQRIVGGLAGPIHSLSGAGTSTPSPSGMALPLPSPAGAEGPGHTSRQTSGHLAGPSGSGIASAIPRSSSLASASSSSSSSHAHGRGSSPSDTSLRGAHGVPASAAAQVVQPLGLLDLGSVACGLGGVGSSIASLRAFSYSELKAATRNFSRDNLLGEGGFGGVFQGLVDAPAAETTSGAGSRSAPEKPEKILVAVKKLNKNGMQGQKEWLAEVSVLGNLKHPQLVQLLGYCAREEHRLLVYELVPNRSLEAHLFGAKEGLEGAPPPLPWLPRLRVLLDAAKGLAYLHEELSIQVIFRDFKAANVLLDNDLHAKLSDFGLARAGPEGDRTHVSTQVVGTVGYAAPEYVLTGHLTARSDVWSFGVVLVEALTGRRALDDRRPKDEANLIDWARPYLSESRRLFRIMDPALDGKYSIKAAQRAAALALNCLHKNPKHRVSMSQVVEALTPLLDMTDVACISPLTSPRPAGSHSFSGGASPSGRFRFDESSSSSSSSSSRSPLGAPSSGNSKGSQSASRPPQLPTGKQQYTAPLVAQLREKQQQQQQQQMLQHQQQLQHQDQWLQQQQQQVELSGRGSISSISGSNSTSSSNSKHLLEMIIGNGPQGASSPLGPWGGAGGGGAGFGRGGGGGSVHAFPKSLSTSSVSRGTPSGTPAGIEPLGAAGPRGSWRERANAGRAAPLAIHVTRSQAQLEAGGPLTAPQASSPTPGAGASSRGTTNTSSSTTTNSGRTSATSSKGVQALLTSSQSQPTTPSCQI